MTLVRYRHPGRLSVMRPAMSYFTTSIPATPSRPNIDPAVTARRNPLLRVLIINFGLGILVAMGFLAGLLALDLAAIRALILQDQSPVTALGLLLLGCVAVFGSATMGGG